MGHRPPEPSLEAAFRAAGGRIRAALAARYRDLDLAEEAFAEACARAAAHWPARAPDDPAAWLYRAASRAALDQLRRRAVRQRMAPEPMQPERDPEDQMAGDDDVIPDERLRLIFVCCHPAVAADARAALTLRLICGLTSSEIARAFLLPEPTLLQRITRAKRKIAAAGIRFETPGPDAWGERLEAVLSTVEVAYAKAHEDAAGSTRHAGYAAEMLGLADLLTRLMPGETDVLALAATLAFAESRRPARLNGDGSMTPLSEQDPALWDRALIARGDAWLRRAVALRRSTPRLVQAAIHRAWCMRPSLDAPPPWPQVLRLYDELLAMRDDPIVRLNRLVALAETKGVAPALAALEEMDAGAPLRAFLPYQAVRAGLLSRAGRPEHAAQAYRAALALGPGAAERMWLKRRLAELLDESMMASNGAEVSSPGT
jgi:RNA polymerase sigma-70 factor, ECF subfamily